MLPFKLEIMFQLQQTELDKSAARGQEVFKIFHCHMIKRDCIYYYIY